MNNKRVNICLISNITLEPYFITYLKKAFLANDYSVSVLSISCFDSILNYEQFKEYDIISLVPNYEVLFKILSSVFISHLGQKNIRLQIWLEF